MKNKINLKVGLELGVNTFAVARQILKLQLYDFDFLLQHADEFSDFFSTEARWFHSCELLLLNLIIFSSCH